MSATRQVPVVVAAAALWGATAALAQGPVVVKQVSAEEQRQAMAHWTRERIAAAPALAMPIDLSDHRVRPAREATPTADAQRQPGRTAAGRPDADAERIARAAYWKDWAALDAEAADGERERSALPPIATGTGSVYTAYDVNVSTTLWKIYPHIWSGKLTFETPSGGASCSATVISNNHIVTAAHCVYSQSTGFYSNWVFTPAFRLASMSTPSAPYGTFSATSCAVLSAWTGLTGSFSIDGWSRHDVAVCRMGNNSAGQTLNGAVGWAGRMWDASYTQLVFNSGYPAKDYNDASLPNPASYLRACTAETFNRTTDTLGSGCRFGRGISGGGWLVGYKPLQVAGQVNSVNSGLFIGSQNLYGARFNSSNIVPLCNTMGC